MKVHAIDYMFECSVVPETSSDYNPTLQADVGQIGMEWLPLEEIKLAIESSNDEQPAYRFPLTTKQFLHEYLLDQYPVEPYKAEVFGR
jgi:hypothetical protein